jgi:hypothetical protein
MSKFRPPRTLDAAAIIVTPEGQHPYRTTVGEFCGINAENKGACRMVRALHPGESWATPYVTVFRVGGGWMKRAQKKRKP